MSYTKKPKTINPDDVDPSVYYYDEIYDDMKEEETSFGKKQDDCIKTKQGSKYIQGIAETAGRRKSEREIRTFKKYARDREEAEANGELDNTDVFVSRSYEKKLKEVRDALREDSKTDGDLELNTFKRHKRASDQVAPRVGFKQSSAASSIDNDAAITHSNSIPQNNEIDAVQGRPRTIEERRNYLNDVLKKKTIGDAFEAAVQRYRQRKTLTS